ncbi:ATP-binding protein [Kitasatospora aburaviensis]
MRAMGVRELAARIGDRFRVLGSGQRGLPARQQTLRAVIDWSWDLLTAPERTVLQRLAVPAGGCSLQAAEAVCAGGGIAGDDVLDLVGRLVDRSLVQAAHTGDGPRYVLLESIAAYARDRLHEAGEFPATAARHAAYFRDLAEEAEADLRGPRQSLRLALLDAESANLRAALDHLLRTGDQDGAARLAAALCPWWLLRGRLHEAGRALAAVLEAVARTPATASVPASAPAPASATPPLSASASAELHVLEGAFAMLTGRRPPERDCPEADIADPVRRGRALWLFAHGLHHAGDPVAAHAVGTRALNHCAAAGDRWGAAAARALLAGPRWPPATWRRPAEKAVPPPRSSANSTTGGGVADRADPRGTRRDRGRLRRRRVPPRRRAAPRRAARPGRGGLRLPRGPGPARAPRRRMGTGPTAPRAGPSRGRRAGPPLRRGVRRHGPRPGRASRRRPRRRGTPPQGDA